MTARDRADPLVGRAGELLLALAGEAALCGRLTEAQQACREAAALAYRLGSAELLAAAGLALEPLGDASWDNDVLRWCADALDRPGLDEPTQIRLLARQTQAAVYAGLHEEAVQASAEALRRADTFGEPLPTAEALTARQLATSGPDDVDELHRLADRMLGIAAGRPEVEMRGRLWRIDAHWYAGNLAAIAAETSRLQACTERVGTPHAHWHLLLTRAALALARAEFTEAEALAAEAVELFERLGHPAAHGASVVFRMLLGHHRGYPPELLSPQAWDFGTDPRWDLFARLGRAFVLLDSLHSDAPGTGGGGHSNDGRHSSDSGSGKDDVGGKEGRPGEGGVLGDGRRRGDGSEPASGGRFGDAAALYRRCGSPGSWRIPRPALLVALGVAASVAAGLGNADDAAMLRDRLAPYRGRFLVAGVGAGNFLGPVELTLGRTAAALGRRADAIAEFEAARARCAEVGAPGYGVEAECLLAETHAAAGNTAAARNLAAAALPVAQSLGMTPWVARLSALTSPRDPLSVREREVAALVAEGLSNRAVAERLVISERTAQNHVQHILGKLGFTNRTQVAAWAGRSSSGTSARNE